MKVHVNDLIWNIKWDLDYFLQDRRLKVFAHDKLGEHNSAVLLYVVDKFCRKFAFCNWKLVILNMPSVDGEENGEEEVERSPNEDENMSEDEEEESSLSSDESSSESSS